MSKRRGLASLIFAVGAIHLVGPSSQAADIAPENLLPGSTQIYYRWDGVAAHQEAYRKSARGQMLAGDTGKFLEKLYERLIQFGIRDQFGAPLLAGEDADNLAARHRDFRLAAKLPSLLAETGIVVGFELRAPKIKLEHVGRAFGLINPDANRVAFSDLDVLVTVIVPNAADRPEPGALMRMLANSSKTSEIRHLGRAAQEVEVDSVRFASWAEGKHFVATMGTIPTKVAIERIARAGEGVTGHRLYKQLDRKQSFEVVSRAYGDAASLWKIGRLLLHGGGAGAFVPAVELTGLTAVQSFLMWEGFDGAESRGVAEAELSGPREGIAKLYKQGQFDLKDLPPLPAEVNRWSAGVFDITAAYEMVLGFFAVQQSVAEQKGSKLDIIARRQEFADEVDGVLGVKLGDMLANLDELGVTYQTPGDGLLNAGQVFAVRIKNEAEFKKQFRQLGQGIEKLGRGGLQVNRRRYEGVDTIEFAVKQGGLFRPAACVCDGWMVLGLFPQSVHGFILRSKGKLPAWKPDDRTAKMLAAIPPGPAAIQYTDPRATVKLLLSASQPFAEYLNGTKDWKGILEPGLLPNPEEACRPLFPGVHWTHNDGKTIRWESRESLALPLEIIGIEFPLGYMGATLLK